MFSRLYIAVISLMILGIWAGPIPEPKPVDVGGGVTDKMIDVIVGPLWSEDGPVVTDILQGPDGDCWLLSVLAALVKCNPLIIKDIVKDDGIGDGKDGADTDKAKIKLLTNEGIRKDFPVDKKSSPAGEAEGIKYWWTPAIQRGVMKMGGYQGINENLIEAGSPRNALRFLTGLPTQEIFGPTLTKHNVWYYIKHSDSSPVILSTGDEASTLTGNHAYAVMSFGGEGADNARLRLRDPNNGVEWYELEDIFADMNVMYALEYFVSYPFPT